MFISSSDPIAASAATPRRRPDRLCGHLQMHMITVRCWPSGVAEMADIGGLELPIAPRPVDFEYRLCRQPQEYPACYEDDPLQAGVTLGPVALGLNGCWLVDEVAPERSREECDDDAADLDGFSA